MFSIPMSTDENGKKGQLLDLLVYSHLFAYLFSYLVLVLPARLVGAAGNLNRNYSVPCRSRQATQRLDITGMKAM